MNKEQLIAIIQGGHTTDGDLADAILKKMSSVETPDQTMIECVAGAISKHISTSLYQREVLAAARYIAHLYCSNQPAPISVTCQIYGLVGACEECNTHAENDVNETNKILADNYLKLTCGSAPSVPEGYVLVPVEPTVDQIVEGQDAGSIENSKRVVRIYKAMLAASRSE